MKATVLEVPNRPADDLWIRLPAPKARARSFYTGLSRTALYDLIQRSKGKIKSVVLKKPGGLRGLRLIHLQSLKCYLNDLAENQQHGEVGPCEN